MGRDIIKLFEIHACVSRHNSNRDKEDDILVKELEGEIKKILENEKYEQIYLSW